jgi:3-oxoacyl-[acyl-carrier protein] reductase
MNLQDRVAVVTGSGRGLGRAYALGLAAAGASVVVNDIDADVAGEVVDEIERANGRAATCVAPVGPTGTAEQLVATAVDTFGRLDIMVTNAGLVRDRSLKKMNDDDFDAVIDTHLRGTFTCGRAAAQHFAQQGEGGRLILVGSPAGQYGNFGQTAYSAAKAGIVCLARTWAMELAKDAVTVNAIIPIALTRMVATMPGMAEVVEQVEQGAPVPPELRRRGIGSVADVASLVVFLASDAAADISGQAIGLGGDKLALWAHPSEVATVFREDGFDAGAIADAWSSDLSEHRQSVGEPR